MINTIDILKHWQHSVKTKLTLSEVEKISPDLPGFWGWKDLNSVMCGASNTAAKIWGYNNHKMIVGKTERDLPGSQFGEIYIAHDQEVIQSGVGNLRIEKSMTHDDIEFLLNCKSQLDLR